MAKDEENDAKKGKGKEEDGEPEAGKSKQAGKKKLIMIVVIAVVSLLLVGGVAGTTLHFMGKSSKGGATKEAQAKKNKSKDAEAEDAADSADATEEEASAEEDGDEKGKPAHYVPLEPPFVVNFEGTGPAKFLQIAVEVMSRQSEAAEHIKKHMPVIRNNLVLLFSSQTYEKVSTLKGKEDLRAAALADVQKILEEETGDALIEALYFTSFVMQ